ncbi:hypothetical protein ACFY8X_38585 [Streptomyces tanashiensis]|uniref:hypothetical protein n=1 Tax=Streptomyces tanashiensis TaxID=67367 RepID=UPI0036F0F160
MTVTHTLTITTTPDGLETDWTHPTDCPDGDTCDFLRRISRMGIHDMVDLGTNRPDGTYNLARFGFHSLCLIGDDGHILHPAEPAPTPQAGDPNGCHWCGINQRTHARQYTEQPGWHTWTQPTNAQIKARMLARRSAT